MTRTFLKVWAVIVGCSIMGTMLVGCSSTESASFSDQEKKQFKNGSAPPPGFEEKMKEQQRKQLEKSGAGAAPAPL